MQPLLDFPIEEESSEEDNPHPLGPIEQPLLNFLSEEESSGEDNSHPLDPIEQHLVNEDESTVEENPHPINPTNPNKRPLDSNDQRPKAPKRVRLTPANFRLDTFSNEVERDKDIPEKCCAICCRLLYPEEYCKLSEINKRKIEEMFVKDRQAALKNGSVPVSEIEKLTWPLQNYRDHNGEKKKLDTHIPKNKDRNRNMLLHKSSGTQSVRTIMEYIRFVNEHWMYPGDQPDELRNLHLRGEGFLSPILVFCELTNSRSKLTHATRAEHHFVSGRIGLYKSKEYLGAHVGTRGLLKLSDKKVKMNREEKQKILRAWDWLKQNHPLIKQVDVDEPSDLMNATENDVIKNLSSTRTHTS
ncbi:MAG: hypothetical protein JOS17DRAFT_781367 [Linnemannia elongata]|nr:MAG: hypothetical protein JOS17DRAFT_781367 [Linnemannia elongata]